MSHSALGMLSQMDFNQDIIPEERLDAVFREMLEEFGYVLMVNVPDSFDPVRFCRRLGRFVPNYNGAVVGDIRPELGMDDVYHAGNTRLLTPHTEGYDFQAPPPRYIALWCVTPVPNGGETTIADTRPWLAELSSEEHRHLTEHVYDWKASDGLIRLGVDLKTRHPILEKVGTDVIVRFSCNNLICSDDDLMRIIQERWNKRFSKEHVAIQYDRNDILIWDNWRLLHARNAFLDRGRHLRRIQISVPCGTT